ncbi:hypothetical protein IU403_03045 [Aerococcaceae bacterium zg-BR22]|uniref:hypothetical protein n=1 Tax=Aerococcaceae bacterium zg-1292 TaxID=2774330 RepID=UPI00406331F0|nr:hypothetical protein [Aerococcaceae bacterium zg-BR22]
MELAKEDKEFNLSSDETFVYYKATPKIEGQKIFEGSISSEDNSGHSISGTTMEFVVRNSKNEEFNIHFLYTFDSKPNRQVSITQEKLLQSLKSIMKNCFSEQKVIIDKATVEYLPIIDNENKIYEYRPTLVLSTTANNSNNERFYFSTLYIDIETGEEVKR